ncbi:MAG: NAD(P)-dependent oxidoreductase [Lachnospiraceae bacterium]|nr:NAD(P)-dependent oxidoreductase [Lachnospiraceae bacterium]
MKPKVLVTQWIPDAVNDKFKNELDLVYPIKEKTSFSHNEVLEMVAQFDALLTIFNKADTAVIDAGINLKAIANLGVGYDSIDVNYATEKNIAVINSPTSVTEATAELTIGLIMASMRNIVAYDKSIRKGEWTSRAFEDKAVEVFGHILGIAGFGRIGKSVCKKAQVLGMKVAYYDPFPLSPEAEKEMNVEYMSLEKLFSQCDCISLHMPYTTENHHLVDERLLSTMKKGSFLINVARGPIVKESALVDALNNGTLKGAALDVYEFEPTIGQNLLACENVVLNPHVGTQTMQVRINMCNESLSGVLTVLKGETPYNLVNKNIKIR